MTRIDLLSNPMSAAGDIIKGGASGVPERLAAGTDGDVLTLAAGVPAWQAPSAGSGDTFYKPPAIAQYAGTFTASGTSTVVTLTPTVGKTIVCLVYSHSRGANSITQTNVVWTKRYGSSGNSRFFEVWVGVVSASPGTTATVAFTGANVQYCEVYELTDAPAFTTGTALSTATAATTALAGPMEGVALTPGDWLVWGVAQPSAASSYSGANQPYSFGTSSGGAGRGGFARALSTHFAVWSLGSGAQNYFGALVKLT